MLSNAPAFSFAPAVGERLKGPLLSPWRHTPGQHHRVRSQRRSVARLLTSSTSVASDPSSVDPNCGAGQTPQSATVSVEYAPGKVMSFETGTVARQAGGAVVIRQGDTIVICTACSERNPSVGLDFLPLRVDYAEKFSSTGRTSGSYIKREGRPSQHETLVSRLIDRPLRPMFLDGYYNEVQLLASVFSYDGVNSGDALAICGSAAALHLSDIPLVKAVAAVRIAYLDNNFVISPTVDEASRSVTELVIAGTKDAILMIEGVCEFLTEEQILEALQMAQSAISKICDTLDELRAKAGKRKVEILQKTLPAEFLQRMNELSLDLDEAIQVSGKKNRESAMQAVKDRVFAELSPCDADRASDPLGSQELDAMLCIAWKALISRRMCSLILREGKRADGRDTATVRPISVAQRFLPCAHGSSLFTRGETQALAVATLGGEEMAQRFENLEGESAARFYLQYSFPPSSVGEVGRTGAPGRREIGHGKLAERALIPVLPPREEFPYVARVESSIMESCGSSSMASVCGGCLALMDAGVPISRPVAGIAMGLIRDEESGRTIVLTDILGLEDALGDMDFKVAGTADAITALQMDIKTEGITIDIMREALEQARVGRLYILGEMQKAQPEVCPNLPTSLPKVRTVNIPSRRIGDVIGPGGKNIKSIIERCGGEGNISISIEDSGLVSVSSQDEEMIDMAIGIVAGMTANIAIGTRHEATVTKVLPFGAYVSIGTGREGWLHISELERQRTSNVEDVCKVGDQILVQVIEVGRSGQFRVSRKACVEDELVDATRSKLESGQGRSNSNPGL